MTAAHAKLAEIVGTGQVLGPDAIAGRATSFWNSNPMPAAALALPESTADVASILSFCNRTKQPVLTHGGLTNCVAAVEPTADDVVVSTEKMSGIIDIDTVGGTVTVEAGTVLQVLQEAVAAEGFCFPLDLGARGSCTIGGNIATNAGGINVLRYGMIRNLVLGLETVLADGTVVSSMNRMLKNNAGYDTKQLFIGSEGTLGIVTRAVLRLFPALRSRQDAIVAMNSFEHVAGFLGTASRELAGSLSAYEVMWNDYYRAVTDDGWHRAPLDREHPFYVVFQAEGSDPDGDAERFERVLAKAMDAEEVVDAVIPKSETEARDIWRIREDFEAILQYAPYYLFDVSLPIRDMDAYVQEVGRRIRERFPRGRLFTLGHIADGNLHFFVAPGEADDRHDTVNACVYEPLAPYGGSISAEHGIGTEKLDWLPQSRSVEDVALMRTIKSTLDPNNILNPGRILK